MKRMLAAAAAAVLAFGIAACSSAGDGSTSCGTFQSMSSSDQVQTIKNMISQHSGSGGVDLTYMSVRAYCLLHSPSDSIDGIYSG